MTSPLHDRIRRARERAGLNQQQLANAVGVSLRTVGNWERGESVPRNRLARIEDALGVRLREPDTEQAPAGLTVHTVQRGRFVLPERLDQLTEAQRLVLIQVGDAILDARREAQANPAPVPLPTDRPLQVPQPDLSRVAARRGRSRGKDAIAQQDADAEQPE